MFVTDLQFTNIDTYENVLELFSIFISVSGDGSFYSLNVLNFNFDDEINK